MGGGKFSTTEIEGGLKIKHKKQQHKKNIRKNNNKHKQYSTHMNNEMKHKKENKVLDGNKYVLL